MTVRFNLGRKEAIQQYLRCRKTREKMMENGKIFLEVCECGLTPQTPIGAAFCGTTLVGEPPQPAPLASVRKVKRPSGVEEFCIEG